MSSYFIHDGRNESGPFNIDELLEKKLTRTTPIRLKDTDQWMPAEKIPVLKEKLVPRKIRRPKDIVPVMVERVTDMYYRQPRTLYSILFGIALFTSISIYSINKTETKEAPKSAIVTDLSVVKPVQKKQLPGLQISPVGLPQENKQPEAHIVQPVTEPVKVDKEKAARQRWTRLISVTNSNYGIGLLGGIKDLSVIVTNHSAYPLEEVVAKVSYIKAGGGIWKTEMITVKNVPANDTKEQAVEDVGRGKKVKVTLYKVVSKKMNFQYAEGQKGRNTEDPYYKE